MFVGGKVVAVEGKDAEGAALLGLAERGGLGFADGAELAGATLDDVAGDLLGGGGGFGARAGGIGEDVEVGEGLAFEEGEGGGVVGFGFPGEAGDYVGA
jgi:hypothetical protein